VVRSVAGLVSALLLGAGMAVVPASSASAIVMVSSPRSHVRVDVGHIRPAVWYRDWDGGPRAYRVRVINPRGHVVFARHGRAPMRWRTWSVTPHLVGTYRTVYRVEDRSGTVHRVVFRTHVRCGCH